VSEKIMALAKDLQTKAKITVNKIQRNKGKSTHIFATTFVGKVMLHGNEKYIFF
jgi:hypothetical protein